MLDLSKSCTEVIKHTIVKVDAQLSKDASTENIGGNVKFKKRKFVYEDDNQPNASSKIKYNRAEKGKSVNAKQPKEKAVEKHDKESLSQKQDNGDVVTKKKTKGEHGELPQNGTRTVLERVKHQVLPHKKERMGGDKCQQSSVNRLKLLCNVDNGATTKQHNSKEKHDSSQGQNGKKSELLHSRKRDLQGVNLATDEKSKLKAGKDFY
ncbi:hypothetical protein HAX54_040835 [Datura stramonium]|uniref:Uncharacterized protein n=1 Tax=Datura stramonium TaxID=4076 RepID=A0ABS8VN65_DATST|nr:hypothetical protein [Datura stramonium]